MTADKTLYFGDYTRISSAQEGFTPEYDKAQSLHNFIYILSVKTHPHYPPCLFTLGIM